MKKISVLLVMLATVAMLARGQDAATEERIKQLNGRMDDFREAQESLKKQIERLAKEIETLREQVNKPSDKNYAGLDELKKLAKAVEAVDQKRLDDNEKINAKLQNIKELILKTPVTSSPKKGPSSQAVDAGTEKGGSEKGSSEKGGSEKAPTDKPDDKGYFAYTIKKGDTLNAIVLAYKEKNIKVTVDQILKANPGLVPEKMSEGKKIWIPAPAGTAEGEGGKKAKS